MVVLLVVLLFIHSRETTQSTILIEPAPIANVTYGKPLYFNCTCLDPWQSASLKIPGETGFKFAIFKDVYCQVPPDKERFYSVACSGDKITFGIFGPLDNVTWQCIFQYNSAEIGNNITKVNILPELPVISMQLLTYVIREGNGVSIPCNFTGNPISNVTWEHNNSTITSSALRQPLNLNLNNISRSAAGDYTCKVFVNFKGTFNDSKTVRLVVEYPPTLKPSNKTTLREGTRGVRLFCEIVTDGNPAKYSNLTWQHWIGNTFIRNLDPDNLPNNSPIKIISLTMQSISFNDFGTYNCLMRNGVGGNIVQSASTELVVEAVPWVLQTTNIFYGQVGKSFKVRLECVGNPPVSLLKVNTKLGSSPPPFYNNTEVEKPIRFSIYDAIVVMNGIILEMNFGTLKSKFNTTFVLSAENSVGTKEYIFLVEAYHFPSEPLHIHIKEFETYVALEWEGVFPDRDMKYEIVKKNISGHDQVVYSLPGSNLPSYTYSLENFATKNNDGIIQICTTNVLGKNCSSTFKVKHIDPEFKSIVEQYWIAIAVVCTFGLLNILLCTLCIVKRRRRRIKRSSRLLSLERHQNSLERNNYSHYGIAKDSKDTKKIYDGINPTFDTYLTPDMMTSQKPGHSIHRLNADGNEYASVDDPAILKMNSERDHYNGVDNGVYLVAGDTKGKTRVPKLPYRPNPKESEYLTAGDQLEEKDCDNDAFVNSDTSPSLLLEIPRRTEDSDITQYLTCSTENEREKQRSVDWWSNA